MSEGRETRAYPVRSLHDFLYELEKEWSKFRNGTLVGLVSSGILFVVVLWLILILRRLQGPVLFEFIFLVLAGAFLAYSIYAMIAQYRFFSRWERRIGLLLHLEEEIIAGKLGDKKT